MDDVPKKDSFLYKIRGLVSELADVVRYVDQARVVAGEPLEENDGAVVDDDPGQFKGLVLLQTLDALRLHGPDLVGGVFLMLGISRFQL
jgi:hypothetical protein